MVICSQLWDSQLETKLQFLLRSIFAQVVEIFDSKIVKVMQSKDQNFITPRINELRHGWTLAQEFQCKFWKISLTSAKVIIINGAEVNISTEVGVEVYSQVYSQVNS